MQCFLQDGAEEKELVLVDPPMPVDSVFYNFQIPIQLKKLRFHGGNYNLLDKWMQIVQPNILSFPKYVLKLYGVEAVQTLASSPFLNDISFVFDSASSFLENRTMFLQCIEIMRDVNCTLHFSSNDFDFAGPQYFRQQYAHILMSYTYFEVGIARYFGNSWDKKCDGSNSLILRNYA